MKGLDVSGENRRIWGTNLMQERSGSEAREDNPSLRMSSACRAEDKRVMICDQKTLARASGDVPRASVRVGAKHG